jgi:hypothetical protein
VTTQAPEDPLGELTPLELGLWRFCFEHNHPVLLVVGQVEEELELNTDFSLLLPHRLPAEVGDFQRGKAVEIHFAEAQLYLRLNPQGDSTRAVIESYGYRLYSHEMTLHTSPVAETWHTFLEDLFSQAVHGGYISASDAARALKPLLSSYPADSDSRSK